jgi:hypothetical protein
LGLENGKINGGHSSRDCCQSGWLSSSFMSSRCLRASATGTKPRAAGVEDSRTLVPLNRGA